MFHCQIHSVDRDGGCLIVKFILWMEMDDIFVFVLWAEGELGDISLLFSLVGGVE